MKPRKNMNYALELTLAISAFIIATLIASHYQHMITYRNGRAWDGFYYHAMVKSLQEGHLPQGKSPYIYRFGAPFLASLVPSKNIANNFLLVDIAGNFITILLLVTWLRIYLTNSRIRLLLILMFLVSFHYPVRMSYFAPYNIDVWANVWLLAGLLVISRLNIWPTPRLITYLCIITAIGVLFREFMLVIPLCLLVARSRLVLSRDPLRLRFGQVPSLAFFLPLVFGMASFLFLRFLLVTPGGPYTFGRAAARHLYTVVPPDYVYAWFIAFGTAFILVLFNWKTACKFLWEHQFLLAYFLLFAVLSYIGGESTYRYARLEFPIVFVLIGMAIAERAPLLKSPIFISLLTLTHLISQRAFWSTPDYPGGEVFLSRVFLTPIGNHVPLLDVLGMGSREVRFVALCQYLFVSALFLLYLNWKKRRSQLLSEPSLHTQQK
jgi:hypothetical protein